MKYEIIVVGGGHAGCEAALASSRKNHKTLLITGSINNIADMPCNPAIGGPAKGIVVREIDALGGEMGKTADKAAIQVKMLNTKKGPAVQALRAQEDKSIYPQEMLKTLNNQENLEIMESLVEHLIVENGKIKGVILETGEKIEAEAVILTTGTYLKGMILMGAEKNPGGPHGERDSKFLSDDLKKLGFNILRLKTGTPPRIDKQSINYEETSLEPGDDRELTFSFDNKAYYNYKEQIPCHLIYTTQETHKIIKEHLKESSMYGGYVEGIGPRYCPSIEDKVVRFADKERHQIFVEPIGIDTDEMYIQGMSSSLPEDVQIAMYRTIPGLEHCEFTRPAYAIEYDCIDPADLKLSLEYKTIDSLFFAGQTNGTSGYEEAACQGLIAGINASQKIKGKEPLILDRTEAYIGVLIDDIVTKGTNEPYRMMTSRAEYRLLLRQDNADLRLTEKGHEIGLISDERYKKFIEKKELIEKEKERLQKTIVKPTEKVNNYLKEQGTSELTTGSKLAELLKRTEITYASLAEIDENRPELPEQVKEEVEIQVKYDGYIKLQEMQVEKFKKMEKKLIPDDINYDEVKGICLEARQKLNKHRPHSIGQASRISGVSPADISVLLVYLQTIKAKK